MNTEMDVRVLRSTGNFLTELPLLPLGGLYSMELDVMLYRCVSEVSAAALSVCKMGYALSYDSYILN